MRMIDMEKLIKPVFIPHEGLGFLLKLWASGIRKPCGLYVEVRLEFVFAQALYDR